MKDNKNESMYQEDYESDDDRSEFEPQSDELNKYNKRIDDLIEDAEIEAEIEAEKKIRAKNTRVLAISMGAMALLFIVYFQIQSSLEVDETAEVQEIPLIDLEREIVPASVAVNEEPAPQLAKVPEPATPKPKVIEPVKQETRAEKPVKEEKIITLISEKKPEKTESSTKAPKARQPAPAPVAPQKAFIKPLKTQKAKITRASINLSGRSQPTREYFIQVGAFSVKSNAQNMVKKVSAKGFNPAIHAKVINSPKHTVYLGRFAMEFSRDEKIEDLKGLGFNPQKATKDGSLTLIMGTFKTAKGAIDLQRRLTFNGFLSTKEQAIENRPTYTVMVGSHDSIKNARRTQEKLAKAGFKNSFIR